MGKARARGREWIQRSEDDGWGQSRSTEAMELGGRWTGDGGCDQRDVGFQRWDEQIQGEGMSWGGGRLSEEDHGRGVHGFPS